MLNFILQPLVENAVFHGIEISRGNGVISISSAIRQGRLVLTVQDNGIGMTPEQLAALIRASKGASLPPLPAQLTETEDSEYEET